MRFIKLSLRNFRGVEHTEVEFQRTGVNVIAGPNEIGKSSLAEAVDLLFDSLDSSGAKAVKAVQPVHRDEGSEVCLEFEAGEYRVTYFKCFNRDRRTELTIHEPRPENLTGREAHDRVLEILGDKVDMGLWRALRIQQEAPLDYPNLEGHGSLTAALDRAAGHARSGETEASLYDAIKEEYGRYYTPSGQPRSSLQKVAASVTTAKDRVDQITAELDRVDLDIQTSRTVVRQISDEESTLGDLEKSAKSKRDELADLERQERELEQLRAQQGKAQSDHREADIRLKARLELVERVDGARRQQEELAQAAAERTPEIAVLQTEAKSAREALEEAKTVVAVSEDAHAVASRDLEFRRADLDHAQLSERLDRVQEIETKSEAAEATLERIRITEDVLEQVRGARVDVDMARAALTAGSPAIQITALREFTLGTNAEEVELAEGEEWSTRAQVPTELVIDDVARISVEPAADSRSLHTDLQEKEEHFSGLLAESGVATLEEAVSAQAERSAAERVIEARDRILEENLRDLSRDSLERKVKDLEERVRVYPSGRESEAPLPVDFDEAKEHLHIAAEALTRARDDLEDARRIHEDAERKLADLDKLVAQTTARADQQATQLQVDEEALKNARTEESDSDLVEAEKKAADALDRVDEQVENLAGAIDSANPEGVRLQAQNAADAVEAAKRRIAAAKEEQIKIQERLNVAGEKGLGEGLVDAEISLRRAEAECAAVERRAAAAARLFHTFETKRKEARAAYVGPLTQHVEELGQFVFGDGFQVELDDNLTVARRTLNGRTVPFESLSGGAREQISVLARIACALTVAEDGGVPLLFDDALGNSDAERLEALGAVLALAGRTCQVIVLTCAPDRYRHVGNAAVFWVRETSLAPAVD